ncbi:hypothetical protein WA158_005553 [Blastocystis sp. Blastoise]
MNTTPNEQDIFVEYKDEISNLVSLVLSNIKEMIPPLHYEWKIKEAIYTSSGTVQESKNQIDPKTVVLSIPQRDQLYKQLLSKMTLYDSTKLILRNRQLDPSFLVGGQYFKSWPNNNPRSLHPLLPCTASQGLIIPCISPYGHILGMQIKPEKQAKRYDTVGRKVNNKKKGPYYSLPNGDTPIYVWIPTALKSLYSSATLSTPPPAVIGICEGGLKPAIASIFLNTVFCGSFTRQFSAYTLLSTCENEGVLLDCITVYRNIRQQGYNVQFAWWGQGEKKPRTIYKDISDKVGIEVAPVIQSCDIDDLVTKYNNYYPQILRYIEYEELVSYCTPELKQSLISHHLSPSTPLQPPLDLNTFDLYQDYYQSSTQDTSIWSDYPQETIDELHVENDIEHSITSSSQDADTISTYTHTSSYEEQSAHSMSTHTNDTYKIPKLIETKITPPSKQIGYHILLNHI